MSYFFFPEGPSEAGPVSCLSHPVSWDCVWGLDPVIQLSDPVKLKSYVWILEDILSKAARTPESLDYSVRVRA